MVTSVNGEVYTPFPPYSQATIEDGPYYGEEGSGLRSPNFNSPFSLSPDVRYQQHDTQNINTMLPSHYESHYLAPNIQVPNNHMLSRLEVPNSPEAMHSHRAGYPPVRNQVPPPALMASIPRLPPPNVGMNFSYDSPAPRRLPELQSGPPYRPTMRNQTAMSGPESPRSPSSPVAVKQESPGTMSTTKRGASMTREPRKLGSNVVIACRQCRARKIRCDSTRPVCHNCTKRGNECEYDAVPKRRGPDKHPGTRQRSCKKRASGGDTSNNAAGANSDSTSTSNPKKKRKTDSSNDGKDTKDNVKENAGNENTSRSSTESQADVGVTLRMTTRPQSPRSVLDLPVPRSNSIYNDKSSLSRRDSLQSYDSVSLKSFPRPLDINSHEIKPQAGHHLNQIRLGDEKSAQSQASTPLPSLPSMDYPRRTWWDQLVLNYAPTREEAIPRIKEDLSFLFNTADAQLRHIYVPLLMRNLSSPEDRLRLQPSLIYAAIAMATLLKSSNLEHGADGRTKALWYLDQARKMLESSWQSNWIDPTLAEAAHLIALFEMSPHPQYNEARARDSLRFLDSIIRALDLTAMDAQDSNVSVFARGRVPVVARIPTNPPRKECSCHASAVFPPEQRQQPYNWASGPDWGCNWSDAEIRKEEYRRLCWSALSLMSAHSSQCAALQQKSPDLFLLEPHNFRLLFPGEMLYRSSRNNSGSASKESVWALYCRSMLLWNSCLRLNDDSVSHTDKAEFALQAWVEMGCVQDMLDAHTCNMEVALVYMCREFLYNSRLTIAQALRQSVPSPATLQGLGSDHTSTMFSKKHAEEWLFYQDQIAKRVLNAVHRLGDPEGHLLSRRPFCARWFLSQIATCLFLWTRDRTLTFALELAKSFFVSVDAMNVLWPCPVLQSQSKNLRNQLETACEAAWVQLPLPAEYSIPNVLRVPLSTAAVRQT